MGLKNFEKVFDYYFKRWEDGFPEIEIWCQPSLVRKGKIRPFKTNKTLKRDDWVLLGSLIKEHKIKTVLEFGTGLSTFLFAREGCKVDTFDTNKEYVDLVEQWIDSFKLDLNIQYHIWDNKKRLKLTHKFDLVVVDGALPRDAQLDTGLTCGKYIFTHDSPQYKGARKKIESLELLDVTTRGKFFRNTFTYDFEGKDRAYL